jgi:hypothetical protein
MEAFLRGKDIFDGLFTRAGVNNVVIEHRLKSPSLFKFLYMGAVIMMWLGAVIMACWG